MSSYDKIIKNPEAEFNDKYKKKTIFETEMSQEPQSQDKQFSPWIKNFIAQSPYKQKKQTSNIQNINFLSSIKIRKPYLKNCILPIDQNLKKGQNFNLNQKDIQAKAQQKFKQINKKGFQQKQQMLYNLKYKRTKHVKLNLNLNWNSKSNLSISPSLKSDEHKSIDEAGIKTQRFHIKKSIKRSPLYKQRNFINNSQQYRFNNLATQQIFYKTLELELPQSHLKQKLEKRNNLITSNSQRRKSIELSLKQQIKSRERLEKKNNIQQQNLKINKEPVNFIICKRINNTRKISQRKIKQMQNNQNPEQVFLKL